MYQGRPNFKMMFIGLFFAASADASTVGNGGYGVRVDGRIVVVDLAARGVDEFPYMSEEQSLRFDNDSLAKLSSLMVDVSPDQLIINAIAKKLSTLEDKARLSGFNLRAINFVRAMAKYSWVNLRELECLDVGDATFPFPNQIQLAYRQDTVIRFCRNYAELSDEQKIALIVHEILYAEYSKGQPHVSRLVGLIFDPKMLVFDDIIKQELVRELDALGVPRLVGPLEPVLSLNGHFGLTSLGAEVSQDGRYALTVGGSPENFLKIWSLNDGRVVGGFPIEKHAGLPMFSADAKSILTVENPSGDRKRFEVKIRKLDGSYLNRFDLISRVGGGYASVHLSQDRTKIFVAESSWIGIYDSNGGQIQEEVSVGSCSSSYIQSVRDIPGGRSLVVGCVGKLVSLNLDSFEERILLQSSLGSSPAYLNMRLWLVTSNFATVTWELCYGEFGCNSTIKRLGIVDLISGEIRLVPADGYANTSISVSSTGAYGIVKFGYWNEPATKFAVLDLRYGEMLSEFIPPNGNVISAEFIPGTDHILTSGGPRPQVYRLTK